MLQLEIKTIPLDWLIGLGSIKTGTKITLTDESGISKQYTIVTVDRINNQVECQFDGLVECYGKQTR